MFAVVGLWAIDPKHTGYDPDMARQIAAGVAHAPGLVKGYWSESDAGRVGHTFIVFADQMSAANFATNVRENSDNQIKGGVTMKSLYIAEVSATT